jgi:hypothetical protein
MYVITDNDQVHSGLSFFVIEHSQDSERLPSGILPAICDEWDQLNCETGDSGSLSDVNQLTPDAVG